MALIRLDKFLTDITSFSRREIKGVLKAGRVKVNGVPAKESDMKIDADSDVVEFDSKRMIYEQFRYYVLNKPAGVISATKDKLSDTVVDLLEGVDTKDLFPVGRLDKDSVGLLLITNDGKLSHELLSPSKHVEKEYFVKLDRPLAEDEKERIESGIDIGDDKPCLPAKVEILDDESALIKISEGRFHQVKRMFSAVGINVTYLKRLSMGELRLPEDLAEGEFIKLETEQIERMFGGRNAKGK